MCLKKEKCVFQAREVSYLGHKIDPSGLCLLKYKIVRPIVNEPIPQSLFGLCSYPGLLSFYPMSYLFLRHLQSLYEKLSSAVVLNHNIQLSKLLRNYFSRQPF